MCGLGVQACEPDARGRGRGGRVPLRDAQDPGW
jgi:hypothetical protein